jgi:hypothetical protein
MAGAMDDAIGGNIYGLDELSPAEFERSSRAEIFGVAGKPERIDSQPACKGNKQANRTRSIMMALMLGKDTVTDVPGITHEMIRRAG